MLYLGKFWAIVSVILIFLAIMKYINDVFYQKFVVGLSKNKFKEFIDVSLEFKRAIEDNHNIFAIGAIISGIIHWLIMKYAVSKSILGSLSLFLLIVTFILGVIQKYIYRDKNGKIIKLHKKAVIILIFILIFHMIFK